MLAFGLTSALFGAASVNMAATLGLSMDEISLLNVAYMAAQLLGLIIAPVLIRHCGYGKTLHIALGTTLCASLMLTLTHSVLLHTLAWIFNGIGVSLLLVAVNLMVLHTCQYRSMTLMTGFTLTLSTLLPMGLYPWLLSEVIDHLHWQTITALQVGCYSIVFVLTWLSPPKEPELPSVRKSSWWAYLMLSIGSVITVFLLMRGSHYNWFDFPDFSRWTIIAAGCLLGALVWVWPQKGDVLTASQRIFTNMKANVFLYNAFLAGFAVMASGALVGSFLSQVMQYNHTNAGWVQTPAFLTMLAGMGISIVAANQNKIPADAMTPIGVVLILISMYQFSALPSGVSADQLWLPLCSRGFGVGLLNVSVTILVFSYFKPEQRPEGIALFYFIRTLGGLVGSAIFSRIIQIKSAQSMAELSRAVEADSEPLHHFETMVGNALLTHGTLPNSTLGASQLSQLLKVEVITQALNNAFICFLLAIFILTPILLIGKKLAAK